MASSKDLSPDPTAAELPPASTRRIIPKFTSFKPPATASTAAAAAAAAPEKVGKEQELRHERKRRHPRSRSGSRGRGKEGERGGDRDRDTRRKRTRDRDTDKAKEKDRKKKDRVEGEHRSHTHTTRDRSRERSRDRQQQQQQHHHRKPRTSRSPPPLIPAKPKPARSPTPDSWDAPKKQYFVDTRGDPDNLVYGTIHRYSVPDYRRRGAGSIVGLSPAIKICRDKGDGKGLVLSTRGYGGGGGSGKSGRYDYAKTEGVRMLRVRTEEDRDFEEGLGFVSLSIRMKGSRKKRGSDSEDEGEEEKEENHYRSIEGLKKPGKRPEDKDLEYVSESDSEGDYIDPQGYDDRQKTIQLVRKVDDEPYNVDVWLEYVRHQDTLLVTNSGGRRTTVAERTSTAEIKLDILQKAINKNPGDERLLVKLMEVATDIWDPKRLMNKWQQILRENPTITGLWSMYINFRQTDFHSFTYPDVLKCFSESLSVLRTACFKPAISYQDREKIESIILYILVRTVLFMRESGHAEVAVATSQALLEANIFRPQHVSPPNTPSEYESLLESFENFWDSEVLRIGEPNAQGWHKFVASNNIGTVPPPSKENIPLPELDPGDPFGSWMEAEIEASKNRKPARTMDEVEEDDPYRVVLFSDLREFMFVFSSEESCQSVVNAFLNIYQLPRAFSEVGRNSNDLNSTDLFLRNEMASINEGASEEWFWPRVENTGTKLILWEGMEPERKGGLGGNPFEFGVQNFPGGPEMLFARPGGWFGVMEKLERLKNADVDFMRNVLNSVVEKVQDETLAVYYLVWEWANHPPGVKKVAKSLLKRFSTSLLLWNAYAQILWGSDPEAGRNVFSTALRMSTSFPETNKRDAILLWKTWIWEELGDKNPSKATLVLLSIESGKLFENPESVLMDGKISPAVLLRTRRYLQDQQLAMLSMGYASHAAHYSETQALLEYLASSANIETALPIYTTFVTQLDQRGLSGPSSALHELTLMRKVRLLYHHFTTSRAFKISLMRNTLEEALRIFPNNTVFLSMYAWNEGRTKIDNRVRRLLADVVLQEGKETVIGWLFAAWAEMRMLGVGDTWNRHAVRGIFEKSVECNRTKSSVQLWVTYIEFELREKEPRRAKEALFRAVRCCPWSKDLAILAFTKLRSALTFEEKKNILSIISSEKELRVHDTTELEDMLEELGASGTAGSPKFMELPDDASSDEEMVDG